MVSLTEVQKHTAKTYKEQHDLLQLAVSLAGETGELLNKIKKINRAKLKDFDESSNNGTIPQLIIQALFEIIDQIYYCGETANELTKMLPLIHAEGLDLDYIWEVKIAMNDLKYHRSEMLPDYVKNFLTAYGLGLES